MEKILLSCVSVILSLVIIFNFSTQEASAHHVKVTWDGMELKKGQIGSIYIKKSTKIYNYIDGKLVFYKTAKAKEKYRVYKVNEGTQTYSIGSKRYFKINDKNITYKKVPKSQYDKVNTKHKYAFRDTHWGDSMDRVEKVTTSKLVYRVDSEGVMKYKTEMLGYDAYSIYFFENNKLTTVRVRLELNKKYHTWNEMKGLFYYLYDELKADLNTKSDGLLITSEYQQLLNVWNFNSRKIWLDVNDKNLETNASVFYFDPDNYDTN
ncbi:hypothetical protein [Peribacillus asahii]|uniref:hypothetical protein n=1 Tax=Peribacillus asahii TaxID=228899 RepID=UPI00207924E8|nr:hypothetical protein [Peribacillus asahii]USK86174.1 hypothetical protein LIT35_05900 [Peribacillus asahii]